MQGKRAELEGAVVVTSPQSAEVRALVGGKRVGFDGFNRALDARRQDRIADQAGGVSRRARVRAATRSPRRSRTSRSRSISATARPGRRRTSTNETHGEVTAVRALAESLNLATVNLGIGRGTRRASRASSSAGRRAAAAVVSVAAARRRSSSRRTRWRSSTTRSRTAASARRCAPCVRSSTREGRTLQRYSLAIEQVADPVAVYALNQGLVQVMERGTGAPARRLLPAGLTTAGKTGTSDDLRDSWFAGFSNDLARRHVGGQRRQREHRAHGRDGRRPSLGARACAWLKNGLGD